jgi:murE/murF fusion protein
MTAITSETRQLGHILAGIEYNFTGNMKQTEITGLCSDSRKVQPGNMFAALKGLMVDGHNYIGQAVAAGCSALLVNHGWQQYVSGDNTWSQVSIIEVEDTKTALGNIAANFYDHPDRQLTVIGITGTNGKTTTSFLLESLLKSCGKRPGVIGTINYRYLDKKGNHIEMEAPFTTPESPTLFALLRKMADENITDVVMEVSSHALAQSRLAGITFDVGVFTNLSRDHLDFHIDMHHYFKSKRLLFTNYLKPTGRVVIVLDDAVFQTPDDKPATGTNNNWADLLHKELQSLFLDRKNSQPIITCGLSRNCDVHPQNFTGDINGIFSEIITPSGVLALKTPLVGEFNLRNMLCAIGIGIALDEKPGCIKEGLEDIKTIPGRLERVLLKKPHNLCPAVFVDYAHTPDALEKVLNALLKLKRGRLICVFGCGGDRDPGKRILMGEVAGRLCDVVLATSDNPRSESPEMILAQVEKGLSRAELKKITAAKTLSKKEERGYDIIVNRRMAIRTAIRFGRTEDIILISGKGHENYQISRAGKIFFDDRIEAEIQLQEKSGSPFLWKHEWVQQITGGRLLFPVETSVIFHSISTDTRTIKTGDLFVGLKGENFDGRAFAERAIEKGAAGLLINYLPGRQEAALDFQTSIPVILVPDTVLALGQLAGSLRRWHTNLQVVAITGSSGKTTVKEMTGAILSQNHHILKTEGNFNNLIGLPLTLFKLKPEQEIAVLEMGMNRPGEIASLTEIADPDVACIINVQEAHLEGLVDIWGVAKAKNELFAGLKPEAKVAVNLDDEIVSSLAEAITQEKITFGCHPDAFVRATDIKSRAEEGMEYVLHIGEETRQVTIKGLGKHNVTNSLAAAAMAHGCGSSIHEIAGGLEIFRPYDKRARIEELPSGIRVLNDCYNANPASMQAALKTVLDLKKDHRAVAVLGDMLELGDKSDAAHSTLGRTVKELGIDFLAAFGNQAENIVASARKAGMDAAAAHGFSSKKELASWLQKLLQDGRIEAGDWFLVKGSRGMRMEEVLELVRDNNSRIKAEGN